MYRERKSPRSDRTAAVRAKHGVDTDKSDNSSPDCVEDLLHDRSPYKEDARSGISVADPLNCHIGREIIQGSVA
jgi:hypothetical protein